MTDDIKITEAETAERAIRRRASAIKTQETRALMARLGVIQTNIRVPDATKGWWTAQANIATGAELVELVEASMKQPEMLESIEPLADLRVTPQPTMAKAVYMAKNPIAGAEYVSSDVVRVTKACVDAREQGFTALEAGATDDAVRFFAMEYAYGVQIRGMSQLYTYMATGGKVPEIYNV